MNCAIAQALEALGDWWTLLIVREAFFGVRRFADFEANLGIAKNILSSRLQQLVEHGILVRVDAGQTGQRFEYQLTEKGRDLLTLLTVLREWADKWVFGKGNEPIVVRDRRTRRRIPRVRITDASGTPVGIRDLLIEPGPGASPQTRKRFGR